MHRKILDEKQLALIPLLKAFKKTFFLVGGTAMALFLGHRKSVDFDLFTTKKISKNIIDQKIRKLGFRVQEVLISNAEEYTIVVNGVKCTFLYYPFHVEGRISFDDVIMLPELLDLAAMKAYTLGRRGSLKDYVDLYFIFRDHFSLSEIAKRAKMIFEGAFNEKLFRQQLCYFEDVDVNEKIDLIGEPVQLRRLKKYLTDVALS